MVKRDNPKFIFVTGGVVSGLGKGITASAIGRLLKQKGYRVLMQKFDPYVNVDTGLLHPSEHGETFVTADGYETDLDLGHYERFIDEKLSRHCSITTGYIYKTVIEKERRGFYKGQTVQIIPHITNEIKNHVFKLVKQSQAQIYIIEIGGTAGDIESLPFIEAIRQMRNELKRENTLFLHCTLIPFLEATAEYKTKPTQQSVAILRSLGIAPDIIVTRSKSSIGLKNKEKIAMFCNVASNAVIEAIDTPVIYDLVNILYGQKIDKLICHQFQIPNTKPNLIKWNNLISQVAQLQKTVNIIIVGKYNFNDAYLSVWEALKHGGYAYNYKVNISLVSSETITSSQVKTLFQNCHGILIAGGFGIRGITGKIITAQHARKSKTPFLGICLGMQIAVIEYARNVLHLNKANSTEFDINTSYPVIDLIYGRSKAQKTGNLRLGLNPCHLVETSQARKIYQKAIIEERHRHKYEFKMETYQKYFASSTLQYSGLNPNGKLIEMMELKDHPFFIGCQFHPEFESRPDRPHALFKAFIKAAIAQSK